MPPFRDTEVTVDPKFNGDLLARARDAGHTHRFVIVDRSYDVAVGANRLSYPGSSADALLGLIRLIPVENNEVICMLPDPALERSDPEDSINFHAYRAFMHALEVLADSTNPVEITLNEVYRRDEDMYGHGTGFYSLVDNTPNDHRTFVICEDELPFACATLIAGHSQRTQ